MIVIFVSFVQNDAHRWPGYRYCRKSLTTVSGTHAPTSFCSGDVIFKDNFERINFKVWKHENTLSGGGNWEFQWYTNNRSNSFTKDGLLFIKPTLTSDVIGEEKLSQIELDVNGFTQADYCTDKRFYGCVRKGTREHIVNPVRSAKITTQNSFAFKYGRVEIRAKMPTGDWLWPALWFLPEDNVYGPWAGSGGIILAESRGNEHFTEKDINIGSEQIESLLHWGPDVTHDGYLKTRFFKRSPGKPFNKSFRKYQMEWTPESIKFSIDGKEYGVVRPNKTFWELGEFKTTDKDNPWIYGTKFAPFDEEFYLIINLAVGGIAYFTDEATNFPPKPWSNRSPKAATDFWDGRQGWLRTWNLKENDNAALQIDYVRIWAL
ncbi:Gram-negative bacteria binding protein 1 [Carabus blaptoides fortunei]